MGTGLPLPRSALCHHQLWQRGQHGDGTGIPPPPARTVGRVLAQAGRGPPAPPRPRHNAAVWVFISALPFHLLSPFHVSTFFSLQALCMLMSLTPAPTLAARRLLIRL